MITIKLIVLIVFCLFWNIVAHAQFSVTVSPVKSIGRKAVVKLEMNNGFPEKIDSVRAVCFLLDGQGAMAGQVTKWVIGGASSVERGERSAVFIPAQETFL